jgi:hypothetical protein
LETDKQYLDNAFRIFAEYSIGIAIFCGDKFPNDE